MDECESGSGSGFSSFAEAVTALFEAVKGVRSALVLTHDDPDPDSIASGVALAYLFEERLGLRATLAHGGIIGRAENKAMVRLLSIELSPLHELDLGQYDAVALVDGQAGAGNVGLPSQLTPTVIIDHHSDVSSDLAGVPFVDIRGACGATSTILTGYLRAAGVNPDRRTATALFYGIKADTMGLARAAGEADVDAYLYLLPLSDTRILAQIEHAQVPLAYYQAFERALDRTLIYDDVVVCNLGSMDWPDLAAEMADFLLRWEGARWIICMGLYEDEVVISVRTNDMEANAGQVVRAVVEGLGTGGGHGLLAGGRVPLDARPLQDVVRTLRRRFLKQLAREGYEGKKLV
ncbi:MAG TPA: DHH family phosphoesterase [Anaerolineae bacterium]|nr:DHH family phosphoesterase [Anaerolineae bacterium]